MAQLKGSKLEICLTAPGGYRNDKTQPMMKRTERIHARADEMHYGDYHKVKREGLEERAAFTELANNTCVLNNEVTGGPYHINQEIFRRDIREGQDGIPLWLDIGVVDVDTCEPLPDVVVEFWHCNATGYYSSYTGIDPDTMQYTLPERDDGTTDDLTFLRGLQTSDENGFLEFLTIFPGWYSPRAVHVHVIAHINASKAENGTLIEGTKVHTGQIFFGEELTTAIHNTYPYSLHSQANRPENANDQVYPQQNGTGYYPVVNIVQLGEDYSDGLLGYINIGVSPSGNTVTDDPGLSNGGSNNTDPMNTVAAGKYASATAHDAEQFASETANASLMSAFASAASVIAAEGSAVTVF